MIFINTNAKATTGKAPHAPRKVEIYLVKIVCPHANVVTVEHGTAGIDDYEQTRCLDCGEVL